MYANSVHPDLWTAAAVGRAAKSLREAAEAARGPSGEGAEGQGSGAAAKRKPGASAAGQSVSGQQAAALGRKSAKATAAAAAAAEIADAGSAHLLQLQALTGEVLQLLPRLLDDTLLEADRGIVLHSQVGVAGALFVRLGALVNEAGARASQSADHSKAYLDAASLRARLLTAGSGSEWARAFVAAGERVRSRSQSPYLLVFQHETLIFCVFSASLHPRRTRCTSRLSSSRRLRCSLGSLRRGERAAPSAARTFLKKSLPRRFWP